jgi:MFS family permease
MKRPFQRILSTNLGILLGIALILRIFIREEYVFSISGYGILMASTIIALILVNLAGAVLTTKSERRRAFLLSILLVLLIGLGVCAVGVQSIPRIREIPG